MKVVTGILVGLIAVFFLAAGITKVLDPVEFARAILRYRLVGMQLAWIGALWLPWLEILSALGLFAAKWRRASLYVLLGLLALFEVVLISAMLRGLDIDCGCLGTKASGSLSFAFVRNGILIVIILFLIVPKRLKGEATRPY